MATLGSCNFLAPWMEAGWLEILDSSNLCGLKVESSNMYCINEARGARHQARGARQSATATAAMKSTEGASDQQKAAIEKLTQEMKSVEEEKRSLMSQISKERSVALKAVQKLYNHCWTVVSTTGGFLRPSPIGPCDLLRKLLNIT